MSWLDHHRSDSTDKTHVRIVSPSANDRPITYRADVSATEIPMNPDRQLKLFGERLFWLMGLRPEEAPEANFKLDTAHLAAKHSRKRRELEMLWLADHKKELVNYQGQWIGLEGYSLIAHGTDLSEVIRQLKRVGVNVPFTVFVPQQREGIFMGL